MATKKQQTVTIWHLRVPKELVQQVQRIAEAELRSVTQQARILLEEALKGRENGRTT